MFSEQGLVGLPTLNLRLVAHNNLHTKIHTVMSDDEYSLEDRL